MAVTPGNPAVTDAKPPKAAKPAPEGAAFEPPKVGGLSVPPSDPGAGPLSEADKAAHDAEIDDDAPLTDEALGTTRAPEFAEPAGIEVQSLHVEGRVPQPIVKNRYWLGVMPDCPWWVVHAGGMDFPRFTEHLFEDAQGNTIREGRNGVIRDLSDEEVAKIKYDIQKIMVQKNGAQTLQFHTDHDGRVYQPKHGDEPLGMYVYLVPVTRSMPEGWRSKVPTSMVRRTVAAKPKRR